MRRLPDHLQKEQEALAEEFGKSDFQDWYEFFEQANVSQELREWLKEEDELYERALKEGIRI